LLSTMNLCLSHHANIGSEYRSENLVVNQTLLYRYLPTEITSMTASRLTQCSAGSIETPAQAWKRGWVLHAA
jgi:hypothetical protein